MLLRSFNAKPPWTLSTRDSMRKYVSKELQCAHLAMTRVINNKKSPLRNRHEVTERKVIRSANRIACLYFAYYKAALPREEHVTNYLIQVCQPFFRVTFSTLSSLSLPQKKRKSLFVRTDMTSVYFSDGDRRRQFCLRIRCIISPTRCVRETHRFGDIRHWEEADAVFHQRNIGARHGTE